MTALVRAPESSSGGASDADAERWDSDCEYEWEASRGDDARRAGVSSLISDFVTIVTGRSVTIVRGCASAACGEHSRIAFARSDAPSRHWFANRSSTSASI